MENNLNLQIDINHPSVSSALVKRKQSGSFPVDMVHKVLHEAGIPDGLMPKAPTITKALERAMQDACRGDKSLEVKVKGRKGLSVYTIVRTNKDRLDLDVDDGKGVSDAELSGKVDFDDNGNYTIRLTPSDHPSNSWIRERVDFHTGQFSNVYDLGVWFGQQLMSYAGALQTGSGDYFIPKGEGFDLVQRVRDSFGRINNGGSFVRIFMMPQVATFADTVDAITDALFDEVERVHNEITGRLLNDKTPVGRRGLVALTERAEKLRDMTEQFGKALGTAFEDVGPRITEIENAIGLAELNIEANKIN